VHAQELEADLQVSQFAAPDRQTEVAVFLAFDAVAIPFSVDDERYSAELPVHLVFQPEHGADASRIEVNRGLRFVVGDAAEIRQGRVFLHQFSTDLEPGNYSVQITIGQGEVPVPFTMTGELRVYELSGGCQAVLSDVILSSLVTRDSSAVVAYRRNGMGIQPNPRLLFGEGLNTLHYYAEAYRSETANQVPPAQYRTFICEPHMNSPVLELEQVSDAGDETGNAILGTFDLSILANGSYKLVLQAVTADGDVVAERESRFFVYNPKVERQQESDITDSEILANRLSPEEVSSQFQQVAIIADENEKRRMRRIRSNEDKRRFIARFWEDRATDSGVTGNISRQEFEFRLNYADERYGTGSKQGWETDRGRVIVKYGLPDNIEDKLNVTGVAPYYIWSYTNIPRFGPGMFIFADRMGFNNFELIHSDVPGERQSINWQSELSIY